MAIPEFGRTYLISFCQLFRCRCRRCKRNNPNVVRLVSNYLLLKFGILKFGILKGGDMMGLPGGSNGGGSGTTTALILAAIVPLVIFGSLVYFAACAI